VKVIEVSEAERRLKVLEERQERDNWVKISECNSGSNNLRRSGINAAPQPIACIKFVKLNGQFGGE
jgi:hypothetical protein